MRRRPGCITRSSRELEIGAGDGNRTHDIQLGKLDVKQHDQHDSCKTAQFHPQLYQGVAGGQQNHPGDLPTGNSAILPNYSGPNLTPELVRAVEHVERLSRCAAGFYELINAAGRVDEL